MCVCVCSKARGDQKSALVLPNHAGGHAARAMFQNLSRSSNRVAALGPDWAGHPSLPHEVGTRRIPEGATYKYRRYVLWRRVVLRLRAAAIVTGPQVYSLSRVFGPAAAINEGWTSYGVPS